LPPPPKIEPESNSAPDQARVGADASGRIAGQSNLHSRTKTARELTIGRKLRELRDQRHLTQQDMAVKAGVPRTYISRIENARLLPGPVMLRRIAVALNVEILDLLPRHKLGEMQDSAPAMSATEEMFWNTLSGYFVQLAPQQKTMVLEHVRGIAGEVLPSSLIAAPAMAAR
jgi:transcriptional regulator with XRE-family HTH domain